jgi:anti-sigma B factor antagonist
MSVLSLPTPPPVTVSIAVRDDAVLVALDGELDIAMVGHARDHLSAAISLAGHVVIVDLSSVTFVDSSGFEVLTRARSDAFTSGVALVCAAPSRSVAHQLSLMGGDQVMPVFGSVPAAVHRYCRRPPRPG